MLGEAVAGCVRFVVATGRFPVVVSRFVVVVVVLVVPVVVHVQTRMRMRWWRSERMNENDREQEMAFGHDESTIVC